MSARAGIAAALLLAVLSTGPARAADPAAGRRIAERWCVSCHVVGAQGTGTDAAPALDRIARDSRRGAGWVRGWLADPHPPMPNLSLTRAEIDDVAAYLASLAR